MPPNLESDTRREENRNGGSKTRGTFISCYYYPSSYSFTSRRRGGPHGRATATSRLTAAHDAGLWVLDAACTRGVRSCVRPQRGRRKGKGGNDGRAKTYKPG